MGKWKGKYRIPSARHSLWDYGADGAYFITICIKNRKHHFGKCIDGKMKMTTVGAMVQDFWYEIPRHFSFVELGEFIVMPNHIHGMLILNKSQYENPIENDTSGKTIAQKRFRNQGKGTVSSIVGAFKSVCSKHIHTDFPQLDFEWQERFWDNIVRDDDAFEQISHYIKHNPENWDKDKFFTE